MGKGHGKVLIRFWEGSRICDTQGFSKGPGRGDAPRKLVLVGVVYFMVERGRGQGVGLTAESCEGFYGSSNPMSKRRKSGPAVLRRGASRPNYYPQDGRAFFEVAAMSKSMVGRFVVVAMDKTEGGEMDGDVLNVGPFETQEAAETWLREDTAKAFAGAGPMTPGEQQDFGAVHFICEVKRAVKPVPVAKVEASLQDL